MDTNSNISTINLKNTILALIIAITLTNEKVAKKCNLSSKVKL